MRKGLLLVFTGNGKGKTTAALGMALRASGHGMRVLILQFIKGSRTYGELAACERLEGVTIHPLGKGFTWCKETMEEDRQLAIVGWARAEEAIHGGAYDLVVLDELNYVLAYGLLPVSTVVEVLKGRPSHVHVIVTGRNAPDELLESADLVTEMREVKHHYCEQRIAAQEGIEF